LPNKSLFNFLYNGSFEWEEEFGEMGGEECMAKFYETVDRVTRECVPTKLMRTGNKPLWMTGNIIRMLRRKRRLWRAYTEERYYRQDFRDYQAYQEVQKEIRKEIKKAKRKLERSLAKKAKKNPKKFYSYLKSKTSNRVSVGPLMGEDGLVTDSKEMASILNAQYTSVFTREDTTNMPGPEYLFTGDDPLTDVRFEKEEVEKKLKNIKASGAPGPDKVWSRVLHDMADILAGPLTIIFNKLMEEGVSRPYGDWPMSAPSSRRGPRGTLPTTGPCRSPVLWGRSWRA
jgi:signal recognition particle subunit SEC65